jgi:DNA-binding PadR family transcriptional regulator
MEEVHGCTLPQTPQSGIKERQHMQYTLTISQTKSLEWGLNAQQALLFAFVYECPSWARPIKTDTGIFYALSKAKITEELPLLTAKPDTAYRLLKQLEAAGVIGLSHTSSITLVRLTDKGREWNRAVDGSEKYPSKVGEISDVGRKNIRGGSEKYPTNQDTSNQDTNQSIKPSCDQQAARVPYAQIFDAYAQQLTALPQLKIKDDARRLMIKRLWGSDQRFQAVEFWTNYFQYVSQSPFLMTDFKAIGFDWLLKPANFKKVLEGNYHGQ